MAHAREAVREAIMAALRAVPAYDGRVLGSAIGPGERGAHPWVRVMPLEEPARTGASTDDGGRMVERTLRVQVIVTDLGGDDPDTVMDDHAALAEAALHAAEGEAGIAQVQLTLTRFEVPDGGESARVLCRVGLVFAVDYTTAAGVPGVAL